jgi:hypothetical protein
LTRSARQFSRPGEILDGLESDDWKVVLASVEHATTLLRDGNPIRSTVDSLERRLVTLATHEKWEVKEAIAHALPYLRKKAFQRVLALLIDDESQFVSRAARRAQQTRSSSQEPDILRAQRRGYLVSELERLRDRYGLQAREMARAAAEKYANAIVFEVRHEMNRENSALRLSLESIRRALGSSASAEVKQDLSVALSCAHAMRTIIESTRGFTEAVETVFQPEDIDDVLEAAIQVALTNLSIHERDFPIAA